MTGDMAAFARWFGVNKSTVSRANAAGRLVKTADGAIDFEKSAAAWHSSSGARTDVAARHAAQRGRVLPTPMPNANGATAAPDVAAPADLAGVASDDGGRRSAKAAGMHYENSAIKLGMALRRGLRLDRESVKREAVGLGAMLRAGVERITDQTAPRLASADHELERRRIIAQEVRRLRWMLRRELPRALRRMRDAGKVGAGGAVE